MISGGTPLLTTLYRGKSCKVHEDLADMFHEATNIAGAQKGGSHGELLQQMFHIK